MAVEATVASVGEGALTEGAGTGVGFLSKVTTSPSAFLMMMAALFFTLLGIVKFEGAGDDGVA